MGWEGGLLPAADRVESLPGRAEVLGSAGNVEAAVPRGCLLYINLFSFLLILLIPHLKFVYLDKFESCQV